MTATAGHSRTARAEGLIGREAELLALQALLAQDGPRVMFVHGIGGVGKSALVEAFGATARDNGAAVIQLDGGAIEPTARGFVVALAAATGVDPDETTAGTARLSRFASRVLVVIDRYEVLRPLDVWLRQVFLPAMPDNTRLILAGREPPVLDWRIGLRDWFATLALGNLPRRSAFALLIREGVAEGDLERIERFARGHPLSLRLAAAAVAPGASRDTEAAPMSAIVGRLTELYLTGLDSVTRGVLDAASVVRRPTLSLLAAMLSDVAPRDAYERLRRLPFVELGPDGLMVHDTVREAVVANLRSSDPDTLRRYRIAAWRQLRAEVARAAPDEMWRYTADLLYILENPVIRNAFFPTTEHRFSVDAARPDDWPRIEAVARQTVSETAVGLLSHWWKRNPTGFRVARDGAAEIVGLEVRGLDSLPRSLMDVDPVARRWRDHLLARRAPPGQHVLFDRFDLAVADEEMARHVMAALMIDLKRAYMELRPDLYRIYSTSPLPVTETPWVQVGFEPVPGGAVHIDNESMFPSFLDFGPGSVDGWLTRVIATELRVEEDQPLDVAQRRLLIDGRRIDLTRLEAEVLRCLVENADRVVDRATLLREAWGYDDARGSNIIEAQVKSIRRKLGPRATSIETVRGIGYRFRSAHQFAPGSSGRPGLS